MLELKDNSAISAPQTLTADEIVNTILVGDNPENIRENLHEMMMAFFLYHPYPTAELKQRVYTAYQTLYDALRQMETLNARRIAV